MRPLYLALALLLSACGGGDTSSGDTAAATTPEPKPKPNKPKPEPAPEPTASTTDFDHDAVFPLTDAHALDCASCHGAGDPGPLDPTCSACHEDDRPTGHFDGTDCSGCHTPTTWAP